MKLDIKIRWNRDVCTPVWAPPLYKKGDVNTIRIDCDYIDDKDDLLNAIQDVVGDFTEHTDFEIINEEQFWEDMDCHASEITNPERSGFDPIRAVLRKYFEKRSNGDLSKDYDPNFSAQDTIDEIADIVGHY